VGARLAGTDPALEEAAQDLGATPVVTFFLITWPVIFPGVLAAALLALAISLDDYVITSFVAGNTQTFPLWVFGATREGVPPQVNVIGTLIFTFGVLVAVGGAVYRSWSVRRLARAPLSRRKTSKPSGSGMWRSRMTTSGSNSAKTSSI